MNWLIAFLWYIIRNSDNIRAVIIFQREKCVNGVRIDWCAMYSVWKEIFLLLVFLPSGVLSRNSKWSYILYYVYVISTVLWITQGNIWISPNIWKRIVSCNTSSTFDLKWVTQPNESDYWKKLDWSSVLGIVCIDRIINPFP